MRGEINMRISSLFTVTKNSQVTLILGLSHFQGKIFSEMTSVLYSFILYSIRRFVLLQLNSVGLYIYRVL